MRYYSKPLDSSWLKAAAIGSLWGSTEIILGSFLHNIKLPLAGSILTFIAIIYMTIFSYIWKDNLIILKGAVITALLKSLSPSAVLIGPMTAIILEGLLFEIALLTFGRNILGFVIGGFFTQISVIIHKIIALLLVYGHDFIRIVDNLYNFVIKKIYVNVPVEHALLYFLLIYGVLGIIASIIGYWAAKHTKKEIEINNDRRAIEYFIKPAKITPNPFASQHPKKNDFLLLFFNIATFIALLWLISNVAFIYATMTILIALTIYQIFYPRAFRILRKPIFWLQLVILFILGALFYYDTPSKLMFNPQGFEQSGLMIYRAILVVVMFGIISIQLNSPQIKSFLLRRGFQNVYLTLELSFLTLPRFLEYISENFDPRIIHKLLIFSFSLIDTYQQNITFRKTIIIEGDRNSGKTTFVKELIKELDKLGLSYGGIYTEKQTNDKGLLNYYVVNLMNGDHYILCSEQKISDASFKTMRFYFSNTGINFGIQAIQDAINKAIIIIDEVGKVELQNYGWSPMLEVLLDLHKLQIWTVRKRYTKQILQKFMINEAFIFDIKQDKPHEVVTFIHKSMFYK